MAKIKQFEAFTKVFVAYKKTGCRELDTHSDNLQSKSVIQLKTWSRTTFIYWCSTVLNVGQVQLQLFPGF